MKKKLMIISGSVLALGVAFGAGNLYTKATTDWQTNAINTANSELGSSGYSEKEKLKASATDDINATVQAAITDDVDSQKAELQKMLDDYYAMKLSGMTETQSFKDLQTQIQQIQKSIYDRYVKEIDAVFAAQAK